MARRKAIKKKAVVPKENKPINKSEIEEFDVEAICGIRGGIKKNQVEYLIKWEGYPFKDNSWESPDGLNAAQLQEAFKKAEDFLLTPVEVTKIKKRAGKENGEYQVETFRGIELDSEKNQILYCVKWLSYPEKSNTWESFSNLENSPKFLKIFADAHEALVEIQRKFADILPDAVVNDQEDVEAPKPAKKTAPARKEAKAQKKGKAKKSADDEEEERRQEEEDSSAEEDVSPRKRGKKRISEENEDAAGSQNSKVSRVSRATTSKSPAPKTGAAKKARGRPKGKGKEVSAPEEEEVKSPARRTRGSSSRGRSETDDEKENESRTSPAKKAKGKAAKRELSLSPAKNGNRRDSLMSEDESEVAVPSNDNEEESDEAPKKTPAKSKAGRPAKKNSSGRRPGPKSKVGTSAPSDEDDVEEEALGGAKKKLQLAMETDDDEFLEDVATKTAGRKALALH